MATKNKAIYVITTFQRIPPTYKLDKTAKIHLHGAESVNTKQWQKGLGPPSTPTMADRDHCVDEDNKSSQSLQKVETCPQQRCHRIKAPTRLNNIRRDGIQVGKLRDQRTLSDERRADRGERVTDCVVSKGVMIRLGGARSLRLRRGKQRPPIP